MIYVGCDPGKSGAIAVVSQDGLHIDHVKLTETETDVWRFLYDHSLGRAWLERVASRPGQGVSSVFKFGTSYGFLRGILTATQVRWEEVTPPVWQRVMKCRSGGDKKITKAAAQRLFPDVKVTHAIADALLIAEYGRRVSRGISG